MPKGSGNDEKFVWPCMGVVANIPFKMEGGKRVVENNLDLKKTFVDRGYHPDKVKLMWKKSGFTGFAVVKFKRHWVGFIDALSFEKEYEAMGHGKGDYTRKMKCKLNLGNKLYCWIAKEEDFKKEGMIGMYLRDHGNLETIVEHQNKAKDKKLFDRIDFENKEISLFDLEEDELEKTLNDEHIESENELDKIASEEYMMNKEMDKLEKELDKIVSEEYMMNEEMDNLNEKEEELEKLEQMQARVVREEKQRVLRRIEELKKKSREWEEIEAKTEKVMGCLVVKKNVGDEDASVLEKIDVIHQEMKGKKNSIEKLHEELNQSPFLNELEEANEALIDILTKEKGHKTPIVVKEMGYLEYKAFFEAAETRCTDGKFEVYDVGLCELWDRNIRDANSFKVVKADGGKNDKTILNEEDPKLVQLKNEYGKTAYEAVKNSLLERKEYNASERNIVPVLWNKEKQRRATLEEGFEVLIKKRTNKKSKLCEFQSGKGWQAVVEQRKTPKSNT